MPIFCYASGIRRKKSYYSNPVLVYFESSYHSLMHNDEFIMKCHTQRIGMMPLVLHNHSALRIQHYELKRFQVFGKPGAHSMAEQLQKKNLHFPDAIGIRKTRTMTVSGPA